LEGCANVTSTPLLKVEDLRVHYREERKVFRGARHVQAVGGIEFTLERGRTLGIVGESGCGKSSVGYALLRLIDAEGRIYFKGQDLLRLDDRAMRPVRKGIQIIFQDASASLDPRMTIGDQISESLDIHGLHLGPDRPLRVRELLGQVGLQPYIAERYPHELSGGQAQRVGICRALAVEPELIICDEAVSALDVSIQAQILNLLQSLKKRLSLSYIFISHDLSVVRHVCDDIAVMYLGRIVEAGSREDLFERPAHPYTKALLSAIPVPDPDVEAARTRITLGGDLPDPAAPPSGCAFRLRCPFAAEECARAFPDVGVLSATHNVRCFRHSEIP